MKGNKKKNNRITPVITILGHVDHGKTTILDKIREANVQACESGGITQKISVFTIDPECTGERELTFIDTPGHEAFDLMRLRGGAIADIVLLIVAADDGVMPQTQESIEIIKNSNAKPIIVLNKCDLPNADPEKVKRQIAVEGLTPEDMGGDIPTVEVSGETGEGIEDLLEVINLLIDVEGLPEKEDLNPKVLGKGFALESVKDKSMGYVSSIVTVQGKVPKKAHIVYKNQNNEFVVDRIKGFITEEGESIDVLNTGYGGKIIGLSELLALGSIIIAVDTNKKKEAIKLYKETVEIKKQEEEKQEEVKQGFWDNYFAEADTDEEVKTLNVIIKSSSEGSLQALINSIEKINNQTDQVDIKIIKKGIGSITQKDLNKAEVAKAIVLGFEIGVEDSIMGLAEQKKIIIRSYDIIYKLTQEIEDTVEMLETKDEIEEEIGTAEIKAIFVLSNGNKVIGGRVQEGIIQKGKKIYIVRDDEILSEGKITSLKHEKQEIAQAQKGAEFGAIIKPEPEDVQEGDTLACIEVMRA